MEKEKNTSPLKTIIYVIIGINVFMGMINGCSTYLIQGDFSEGFMNSTGWLIKLSGVVIVILIFSGLFGLSKGK